MEGGYNPHMVKITLTSLRRLMPAVLLGLVPILSFGCNGGKPSTGHILELRAGSTTEVEGWKRTDVVIGGSRVWMSPDVAVDDDMIESVEKTLDQTGLPSLYIRLDPEGAEKLERLSTEQLSRPIVVVVDGRPTSAPIVQSPLRSFIITAAGLNDRELDGLARRLEHAED